MRDVLLPLLIVAACGGIVVVVRALTRPKPSRSDLVIPGPAPIAVPTTSASPPVGGGSQLRVALADWHLEHGDTLLDRIDTADRLVDPDAISSSADDAAPGADIDGDALAAAFAEATEAHPAPEMRAELAAMQAAIDAFGHASDSGDDEAAARHRATYVTYRTRWLERLWQFPADARRVSLLRQRSLDGHVTSVTPTPGVADDAAPATGEATGENAGDATGDTTRSPSI